MNREIKFRAWDLDEDLPEGDCRMWDNGELQIDLKNNKIIFGNYKNESSFEEMKLMQFTGLKDKNGKEIYEGDILKINNNCRKENFIVTFGSCDYYLKNTEEYGEDTRFSVQEERDYEVVGNIYENPELLKDDTFLEIDEVKE